MPNLKPVLLHIKVYSSRAYIKTNLIPKQDKVTSWVHIGYLVGFDSTTIYQIGIPGDDKVEWVRNVTFNETLWYDPNNPQIDNELRILDNSFIETIRIPELLIRTPRVSDDDYTWDSILDEEIHQNQDSFSDSAKELESIMPFLPTPRETPSSKIATEEQKALRQADTQLQEDIHLQNDEPINERTLQPANLLSAE